MHNHVVSTYLNFTLEFTIDLNKTNPMIHFCYNWCISKECCVNATYTNVTFILYFVITSFSFFFFLPPTRLFRSLLWLRLHHFCSYSPYLELSRYFFFYDIYLCWISDSRMFIVSILTWSIWHTVSVHWKLLFIMLQLFTKKGQ